MDEVQFAKGDEVFTVGPSTSGDNAQLGRLGRITKRTPKTYLVECAGCEPCWFKKSSLVLPVTWVTKGQERVKLAGSRVIWSNGDIDEFKMSGNRLMMMKRGSSFVEQPSSHRPGLSHATSDSRHGYPEMRWNDGDIWIQAEVLEARRRGEFEPPPLWRGTSSGSLQDTAVPPKTQLFEPARLHPRGPRPQREPPLELVQTLALSKDRLAELRAERNKLRISLYAAERANNTNEVNKYCNLLETIGPKIAHLEGIVDAEVMCETKADTGQSRKKSRNAKQSPDAATDARHELPPTSDAMETSLEAALGESELQQLDAEANMERMQALLKRIAEQNGDQGETNVESPPSLEESPPQPEPSPLLDGETELERRRREALKRLELMCAEQS